MRVALLSSALLLSACGLFGGTNDLRIDESDGVPNVEGNQTVNVPANFMCGTPITDNGVTVTTRVVSGGCEFKLDQDVQVLTAADYSQYADLTAIGTRLVKAVEMNVITLEFTDATSGQKLDLQTRVSSATLSINGQEVADKAALSSLPLVVQLTGNALTPIKSKIEAKQPVSVHATAVVVLPNTPAPPAKLGIKYLAKAAIILGI